MRRMRRGSSSFSIARSAMTDFIRRPCSSTRSSCRILSPSLPAARKASCYWRQGRRRNAYLRLVDSRSAPRSSSSTTLILRLAERAALAAAAGFRPRFSRPPVLQAGPESGCFVFDIWILLSAIQCPRKSWGGGMVRKIEPELIFVICAKQLPIVLDNSQSLGTNSLFTSGPNLIQGGESPLLNNSPSTSAAQNPSAGTPNIRQPPHRPRLVGQNSTSTPC